MIPGLSRAESLARVKQYMRAHLGEHVDWETGELCCTTLAEDAQDAFQIQDPLFFDWAFEVSEE
jgi:hypothetical protein